MLATSRYEVSSTKAISTWGWVNMVVNHEYLLAVIIIGSVLINKPLAGTGKPINTLFCLVSILNLASLTAEKEGISKAAKGRYNEVVCWLISMCIIHAGSMPKVIKSARESSCWPSGEYALSSRATQPSRKSHPPPSQRHNAA